LVTVGVVVYLNRHQSIQLRRTLALVAISLSALLASQLAPLAISDNLSAEWYALLGIPLYAGIYLSFVAIALAIQKIFNVSAEFQAIIEFMILMLRKIHSKG
jgi:hypothetical protein